MKRQLVLELWNEYRKQVIPANATSGQIRQCRMAFYGGAHAIITALMRNFTEDREPTEDDMQVMENVQEELDRFAADVLAGKT